MEHAPERTDATALAAATPATNAAHLAPDVAARLCLLGGESAGKTTLAQALAQRLQTGWVPEYGRERWLQIGGTFSVEELLDVGRVQVAREEAALPQARGWLVCDTSPLTTLVYSLLDHGSAAPELEALARRHYDLILLCAPDFHFVQDGARRDDGFRNEQHALTLKLLHDFALPHVLVQGSLGERMAQVLALLERERWRDTDQPQGTTGRTS